MKRTAKKIKNAWIAFRQWLIRLAILSFQVSLVLIVLYRVVPVPITPFHIVRVFEQVFGSDEVRLKKSWRGIDDIGDKMILASLTSEDPMFFKHFGFDFEQIQKSIERAVNGGKKTPWCQYHFATNGQKSLFYSQTKLGSKGARNVCYGLYRSIVDQKTHFGSISQYYRNGKWNLWC